MPEYVVTWTIDCTADSPAEAAAEARDMQTTPGSLATVYEVTDPAGTATEVDLPIAGDPLTTAAARWLRSNWTPDCDHGTDACTTNPPPAAALVSLRTEHDQVITALFCPHCGDQDTLAEVDRAVRWNRLHVEVDGAGRLSGQLHLGPSDFEHDGWICTACVQPCTVPLDGQDLDWS